MRARFRLVLTVDHWFLLFQFVAIGSIATFVHSFPSLGAETDFVLHYGPQAKSALAGRLLVDDFRGPLYPLLVALLAGLSGLDVFRAGVWLSLFASLGASKLILVLARQLGGARVAFTTALMTLASSSFVGLAYVATTDMVFLFLSLLIVYLLTLAPRASRLFGIGLVSGLLLLLRYNAIFCVLAALAVIALACREEGHGFLRASALRASVALLGVACLVVPWGCYTLRVKGAFLYNKNYLNLAYAWYGQGDWEAFFYPMPHAIGPSQDSFASLSQVLQYDPISIVLALLRAIVLHPCEDLLRLVGVHLAILLIALPWTAGSLKRDWLRHPLAVFALVYFVGMLPMFHAPRLYLLLLPCYGFVLAQLACSLYDAAARQPARRALLGAYAVGVALVSVFHSAASWSENPSELQTLADALRQRDLTLTGKRVIARKPHLCYLVDCQHVAFPQFKRIEELAAYMCEQRIEYVLYGRSEQRQRAELYALANATSPAGLEAAATVETSDGRAATRLLRLDPQRCPRGAGQRSPEPPSAPLMTRDTLTSTL